MLTCTVCGEQNEDLAVTCRNCHSFLQNRVDAIDLFSTLWGLIEHPRATFRKIVISRHKNYVLFLCVAFGVYLGFLLLSYLKVGSRIENLGSLFGIALVGGPIGGIIVVGLAAVVSTVVGRALGGKGTVRNLRSVSAYASFPIACALVFVFPVKFGVFGKYLFDPNPAPAVINPTVHFALLGFDVVAVCWAGVLLSVGIAVAHSFAWWKGALTTVVVLALVGAGALALRGT
jgi:hypothetical protein